jgi:oxygen-independent coproporphyrinogen-3 oxidase
VTSGRPAPLDAREAVPLDQPIEHLYVHLPFCARKCPYCDFNSHAGRDDEQPAYFDALLEEARRWAPHLRPRTIFVGGGTPTHGSASVLAHLFEGLQDALELEAVEEFTVEANPGSLDRSKIRLLKASGVNRMSIGVQSFDDARLEALGRIHTAADAVRSVELLREGGMPRFSLDLMLAVPGQDLAGQSRDLARALDLGPEHVSAYVLTFEEGTAFTRLMNEGRMAAPDADRELAHLQMTCARLGDAGYERYEISNFARPGAESQHNLAYWRNANWIGLGAGAHSHAHGLRWKNLDDPAAYTSRVRSGEAPEAWRERPDAAGRTNEFLLMGLRLAEGVDLARIASITGCDVQAARASQIGMLLEEGLVVASGTRLALTTRGFDLANEVIRTLSI